MRNLLGRIPHADKPVVAAMVRTVFAQPSRESADLQLEEVARRMEKRWSEVARFLRDAEDEILAYMAFPSAHWTRLYSTNSLERFNREVRRRSDVVQVFPDDASILRLIGTVLMDLSDDWAVDERSYFSQNSMRLLLAPEMATTEPGPALAPVRQADQHHALGPAAGRPGAKLAARGVKGAPQGFHGQGSTGASCDTTGTPTVHSGVTLLRQKNGGAT